ncbi:MAG: phosphate signaling complex PhoU family protein [Mycoplasma sp.]
MINQLELTEVKKTLNNYYLTILDYSNQILKKIETTSYDSTKLKQLVEHDLIIDREHYNLTEDYIWFIAKKRPLALDLRRIIAYILIIKELERVSDGFKNVAKNILSNNCPPSGIHKYVAPFYKKIVHQFEDLSKTLTKYDLDTLKKISAQHMVINQEYHKIASELNHQTVKSTSESEVALLTSYIVCLKNLERTDDHLVNICEEINYIYEGTHQIDNEK